MNTNLNSVAFDEHYLAFDNTGLINMRINQQTAWIAEKEFLDAWKKGVHKAGIEFFIIQSDSIDAACHKEQLAPNYKLIKNVFGTLNHGQQVILAMMYSFFNAEEGQNFLVSAKVANFVDAFALMDTEAREIIIQLLKNYRGW